MAKHRVVQHRPKRESKETKPSELQELRKTIQRLTRENARLRKEAHKLPESDEPEVEVTLAEKEGKRNSADCCPNCHSPLQLLDLNVKILLVCYGCKFRKPLTPKE